MKAYALIDLNFGEPVPVLGTVRETEEGAWAAAISPRADPTARLYSGSSEFPLPSGTPGRVDTLKQYGFEVSEIEITITELEGGE